MVDQITTTATRQGTETTPTGERSAAIATLRSAERYDHVRIAPLDASVRVLNQIGDFDGVGVRAGGGETTYLIVAEPEPDLPDIRIDRWDGTAFRAVLRTSRVCVDEYDGGDDGERVFRVPAGVRVDRDRRTGGGRARIRTDGGRAAVETARDLSVGERVRVAGDELEATLATVKRVDDDPPVASELFEGARHVFLDVDGQRLRVLTYQTANGGGAIHLATPDAGVDGTWESSGTCTTLERVEQARQ